MISIVRKTDDEPKDEPDDSVKDDVKKDEGSDSDKEGVSMKKKEEAEAVEVRDVSYNLEILVSEKTLTFWLKHSLIFLLHWKIYPKSFEFLYLGWGYTRKFMFFALIKDRYHHLRKQLAMKERNLKIRNVTWVFAPVPQRLVLSIFLFSSKNNLCESCYSERLRIIIASSQCVFQKNITVALLILKTSAFIPSFSG